MLVHLDQFEGPLGLLLYLIRKEEMDIYDIEIHRITSQYLSYIKQLPSLDLEQAGDFCAMAATLLQIKSKMLLPNYDENGEELVEEDPRKPLVQKLLEYEKYQLAAKELYERPLLGRDSFARGQRESIAAADAGIELEESALFSLIACYRSVIRKAEKAQHRVSAKFQSIASRILEIREHLVPGKRVRLRDLIRPEEWTATKYLITFLSSLELGKLGYVHLFQAEDCGDIHIETQRNIAGDVVTRVAEYDDGKDEAPTAAAMDSLVAASAEEAEPEMASDEEILAAEQELSTELALSAELDMADTLEPINIDAINERVQQSLAHGGFPTTSASSSPAETTEANTSQNSENQPTELEV